MGKQRFSFGGCAPKRTRGVDMVLYVMITVLTVSAACFVNRAAAGKHRGFMPENRQEALNRILLAGIFMTLFAVSALRIGIGNDYWTYRYNFLHILSGDTKVAYEIGFQWLVRALQTLFGYDNYRVVFAFMAFVTCALFLKGLYDNSDWFAMSFFLFMANGFYFMSFTNVRYYFAISVCLYAMKYLFQKDFVRFVLWILLASLVHKSVLLTIPVFLAAFYLKWNRKTLWLIPAVCGILALGKEGVRRLVFFFYPYYEGDLILDVESVSYVNIAKCLAVLIFALLFYKRAIQGNPRAETLFNLNLFSLIIYSFGFYIPETSRVCYYMAAGNVFLIPVILRSMQNRKQRAFFTGAVAVCYAAYFMVFLVRSRASTIQLLPYLTWLFD